MCYENIMNMFEPEMAIISLIASLLETMSIEELSDLSEIKPERINKILSLEGNPTLGEIKNLARAGKKKSRNRIYTDSRLTSFSRTTAVP